MHFLITFSILSQSILPIYPVSARNLLEQAWLETRAHLGPQCARPPPPRSPPLALVDAARRLPSAPASPCTGCFLCLAYALTHTERVEQSGRRRVMFVSRGTLGRVHPTLCRAVLVLTTQPHLNCNDRLRAAPESACDRTNTTFLPRITIHTPGKLKSSALSST